MVCADTVGRCIRGTRLTEQVGLVVCVTYPSSCSRYTPLVRGCRFGIGHSSGPGNVVDTSVPSLVLSCCHNSRMGFSFSRLYFAVGDMSLPLLLRQHSLVMGPRVLLPSRLDFLGEWQHIHDVSVSPFRH